MADRMKSAAGTSKTAKPKRASTCVASTSRTKLTTKEKAQTNRPKIDDTLILDKEQRFPDVDSAYRNIAYGRYMREMLNECLVDEKIEREETALDVQMALLAERFRNTMKQFDKTNNRLKDISFVVEQKRLLDLKSNDSEQLYQMAENSNTKPILQDLLTAEQPLLDKLELRNVDFGYDKISGHKQLLDAVNDAIEGLANIKKESKLDAHKFEAYEYSKECIQELENDKFNLESLTSEFAAKFPTFNEQLIREASEKIASIIGTDDIGDDMGDEQLPTTSRN